MKYRLPRQKDALIDGRHFAVVPGRRWTKVDEYLSNGQLTCRWFVDEATGEVREADGKQPKRWMASPHATQLALRIVAEAQWLDTDPRDYEAQDTHPADGAELILHTRGGEVSFSAVCTADGRRLGCRGVYTPEQAEALAAALAAYARVAKAERRLRAPAPH